ATGNVVLAAVQGCRLGQAGDRVLRRRVRSGVRSRRMGGYGAIVDDPSTARHLALHELYRFLGAEKRASEVGADDRAPLFIREVFKRHWWSAQSCIVEEEIQPPERLSSLREKSPDRPRVGDIRLNNEHSRSQFRSLGSCGLQRLFATAGQNHGVPRLRKTTGSRL